MARHHRETPVDEISDPMTALAGADLFTWLALRRVRGGRVAKVGDRYLDGEIPVPGYVAAVLDELIALGLLALATVDPSAGGRQQIAMTESGGTRYLALSEHAPAKTPGICGY
jgi:hypothetical protein